MTRREWLSRAAAAASALAVPRVVSPQSGTASGREDRIARLVQQFEQQGFHRTGTAVDQASADWLSNEVRRAGASPIQEPFPLDRVDIVSAVLIAGGRRIEGVPLFDGTFTGTNGVSGRLGPLGSDAEIGLSEITPNAAGAGAFGEARRANRHRAIVAVTRGRRTGLCPSNADSFREPYGPPVLQVSSDQGGWVTEQAAGTSQVQLIAQVKRTEARAMNVTVAVAGTNTALPPLVVMTPRSGWYSCASERGGGIACWLEILRAMAGGRPARTVLFVASSGHELGHLGLDAFVDARPGIVKNSVGWLHLGANVGAATGASNTVQASDDGLDGLLSEAMRSAGLRVDRRVARTTIPGGEAEVVHRGGGRYVSIIGGSELFHNPDDRGPQAIDPSAIAKFSAAFIAVAEMLSTA